MKQKTLTLIIASIFIVGIIGAVATANTLSNLDETINIPVEVIAGIISLGDTLIFKPNKLLLKNPPNQQVPNPKSVAPRMRYSII